MGAPISTGFSGAGFTTLFGSDLSSAPAVSG